MTSDSTQQAGELAQAIREDGCCHHWKEVVRFLDHVAAPLAVEDSRERCASSDAKDAARYRWLRDVGDASWRPFAIRAGYSATKADAAIDAAMAAASSGDTKEKME